MRTHYITAQEEPCVNEGPWRWNRSSFMVNPPPAGALNFRNGTVNYTQNNYIKGGKPGSEPWKSLQEWGKHEVCLYPSEKTTQGESGCPGKGGSCRTKCPKKGLDTRLSPLGMVGVVWEFQKRPVPCPSPIPGWSLVLWPFCPQF